MTTFVLLQQALLRSFPPSVHLAKRRTNVTFHQYSNKMVKLYFWSYLATIAGEAYQPVAGSVVQGLGKAWGIGVVS